MDEHIAHPYEMPHRHRYRVYACRNCASKSGSVKILVSRAIRRVRVRRLNGSFRIETRAIQFVPHIIVSAIHIEMLILRFMIVDRSAPDSNHRLFLKMLNCAALGFSLLIALSLPATAQTIYTNDFESTDVTGWSTTVTNPAYQRAIFRTQTPIGARVFLGDFGSQSIDYTTVGLPAHDSISVEFDLLVIRTWDGNATDIDGPDLFIVRDSERGEVLRTSFSNTVGWLQAYPGAYPSTGNPRMTGAREKQSLGYMEGDAVYHLRIAFAHSGASLAVSFEAALRDRFPSIDNESWGIDNISIEAVTRRPSSANLVAGKAIGAPGDEVLIPIYARNAVELASSGATSIRTRVRFNASMLLPISPTPPGVVEGNDRVIDITLPLNIASDSALDRLNFRVFVGDDTVTAITLESSSAVGGPIALTEQAGEFRMRGLCEDGGVRLFRSEPALLLRAPYPNPVNSRLTIEYEIAADAQVRIELLDASGATQMTVHYDHMSAGIHALGVDTGAVPAGTYQVRISTGSLIRQRSLVVVH